MMGRAFSPSRYSSMYFIERLRRIKNKNFYRGDHSAAEPQPKTFTTEGTEITEKVVKK
jgi:hypothetical protein